MKYLIALTFALGISGLLHQRFVAGGSWFDWSQVLGIHHEPLILGCFITSIGLLISKYWRIKFGKDNSLHNRTD